MSAMTSDAIVHGATPRMLLAARALAEAIFSTEAGPPPAARLDWLMRELDDFLGRAGARARLLLRLSILAVSWLAPLLSFRLRPLRALALPARIEALERLERSRAAMPLLATKAILSLLYYEHPDAACEVGFDGACLVGPYGESARSAGRSTPGEERSP